MEHNNSSSLVELSKFNGWCINLCFISGNIYHHYALGRSAIGNLIPKPTTALEAVIRVIPELNINSFNALSFRTPTEIVGSADITFITKSETSTDKVLNILEKFQQKQEFQ